MARPTHFYLTFDEEERLAFLAEVANDDLLLLRADLDAAGEDCPLLATEQRRRGLPPHAPEDHLLPESFFERDEHPRRLPKPWEYAFRRWLYLSAKYCLFLSAPLAISMEQGWDVLLGISIALYFVSLLSPLALGWFTPFHRPLRYTLVRPFNSDEFAKPLKRFLVRNIGLRAQGLTLSDRHFEPNQAISLYHRFRWLVGLAMIPLGASMAGPAVLVALISTWVRQSIRITTILAPSGFLHLPAQLRRRRLMAGQHLFCGGQCFNIRTIDEAWRYAMQALVHESDFVLVDLSYVRAGSQWEIELLQLRDRVPNCIALCQVGHEQALERYAHLFPQVLFYDERGRLQGEPDLVRRIRAAVAAEPRPADERHERPNPGRATSVAPAKVPAPREPEPVPDPRNASEEGLAEDPVDPAAGGGTESSRASTDGGPVGPARAHGSRRSRSRPDAGPPHPLTGIHVDPYPRGHQLFVLNLPGCGLTLLMGFAMIGLQFTGQSWPTFAAGVLVVAFDLVGRLRYRSASALIHPRAGGHVLFLPLWVPGLLLVLVGFARVQSAAHEALDRDLVALMDERASGEAELAEGLLDLLAQDLRSVTRPEQWHARIRMEEERALILLQAPTSKDFGESAKRELLEWIDPGPSIGDPDLFIGLLGTGPDDWEATRSPRGGLEVKNARVEDVLPFYVDEQDRIAGRRTALAVSVLVVLGALLVGSFRRGSRAAGRHLRPPTTPERSSKT